MTRDAADQLVIRDGFDALIAAEAHVESLHIDIKVRDEMIAELLVQLRSQTEQVNRLIFRLKNSQEAPRG